MAVTDLNDNDRRCNAKVNGKIFCNCDATENGYNCDAMESVMIFCNFDGTENATTFCNERHCDVMRNVTIFCDATVNVTIDIACHYDEMVTVTIFCDAILSVTILKTTTSSMIDVLNVTRSDDFVTADMTLVQEISTFLAFLFLPSVVDLCAVKQNRSRFCIVD